MDPTALEIVGHSKVYIDNTYCNRQQCTGGNLLANAVFDHFSDESVQGAWSQINAVVVSAGTIVESFDERLHHGQSNGSRSALSLKIVLFSVHRILFRKQ